MSPDLLRRALRASSKRVERLDRQVVQAAKTYVWASGRPIDPLQPRMLFQHRAQAVADAHLELCSLTLQAARELERWARLYKAERERVYATGSEPPRDPASPGLGTQSPTGRPK